MGSRLVRALWWLVGWLVGALFCARRSKCAAAAVAGCVAGAGRTVFRGHFIVRGV